jgi:hypothetical protein
MELTISDYEWEGKNELLHMNSSGLTALRL